MDVRKLSQFVAIVEAGSLSRAAVRLHIAQPALTHAVQALEEELGVPLLERHARGVALTEFGELLVDHARTILREVDRRTQVSGYDLTPGDAVCLYVFAMQRDPRWFPDPDKFRLDRYLEGSSPTPAQGYAPFGIGKRACPGGRVAVIATVGMMARLLQRGYRWQLPAGAALPPPVLHMGLRPRGGPELRLVRK